MSRPGYRILRNTLGQCKIARNNITIEAISWRSDDESGTIQPGDPLEIRCNASYISCVSENSNIVD